MKVAIVNCPDTGPLNSIREMLGTVGYTVTVPGPRLRSFLQEIGVTLVQHWSDLQHLGYTSPSPPIAESDQFNAGDLYVDVKVNGCRAFQRWNANANVLWYRIQGGYPEVTPKGGDEVNPPCPVLTANRWYLEDRWREIAYVAWLPLTNKEDYIYKRPAWLLKPGSLEATSVSLIHGVNGWGYAPVIERVTREVDHRVYGANSPYGVIHHSEVADRLADALCYVQFRSNDSPGYALYEAMFARCPLIVPRRFIARMNVGDLFVEHQTCRCFDRPDGDCGSESWANDCAVEVIDHFNTLKLNPSAARRLASRMLVAIQDRMWDPYRTSDVDSLQRFMTKHFGKA